MNTYSPEDTHMAVWEAENPAESSWERWIEQVEDLLKVAGRMPADCHTMTPGELARCEQRRANGYGCWRVDGDQRRDGWCMDAFYQLWEAQRSPSQAVAEVGSVVYR